MPQGSTLQIVSGAEKLSQDMSVWLRERYGVDRFHLTYGSVLQDFIGSIVTDNTKNAIQSEVLRILRNYQKLQMRALKSSPNLLSLTELLQSIDSVYAYVSFDTVQVQVRVSNAVGQLTTVSAASTVR